MKKLTKVIKENAEQLRTYSVSATLQVKYIVKSINDGDAGISADNKIDDIDNILSESLEGYELLNYQLDGVDEMGSDTELNNDIKESFLIGTTKDNKTYSIGTFVKHIDSYNDIWSMQHDGTQFDIYNGGLLDIKKAYLFKIKNGQALPIDLSNIITL